MLSSVSALFAAVLVAAAPGTDGDASASSLRDDAFAVSHLPAEQIEDMVLEALPPPPLTVIRETKYYGTVTIDHRAHLARKAACKTCHGTGSITKIEYTAKVAHDRCITCHQQQKGPTNCQGCHVKVEPPPPVYAAPAPETLEPAVPPPNPANLAAAMSALNSTPDSGGFLGKESFYRYLEVGFAAGRSPGISVRLASHQNFIVVTQSIERMASGTDARTIGLLGAGASKTLHSKVAFELIGLAGFDAVDRPILALLPAIGGRAGLEWRPRFNKIFQQFTASVTTVHDLSTRQLNGDKVGGTTVYGTVATGFTFPPK
jgi:hypothetical protein